MRSTYVPALCLFYALTQVFGIQTASAQLPQCDRIYINFYNATTTPITPSDSLFTYDPSQPVSATNPSLNTIRLPLPNVGLTISPVLGSGSNTLTYYTCTYNSSNILQYIYYDPVTGTWVNTGHSCGPANYVNFAAGGGYVYSLNGLGSSPGVYRYDGTGDATYLTRVSVPGPYDLVADCEGNFYVISYWGPIWTMTKYSSSGTVLQGYSVNNPSLYSLGGGLGIINNDFYVDDFHSKGIAHATLTGNTLNFTGVSNPIPFILSGHNVGDFGSCAQMTGGLPTLAITATVTIVCTGTAVSFNSSNTNGGNNPQYQWLKNGIALPGATGSSLTYIPADNDTISVQMISSSACSGMTVTSPTITIHVHASTPGDPLAITATDTIVCAGTSVLFSCTNDIDHGAQYQWFKNGVPIPGATDSSLIGIPANNDVFMLQETSTGACSNTPVTTSSPVITMHVQARPSASFTLPATVCKGDTITAVVNNPANIPYQWDFGHAHVLSGSGAGPYELVWNQAGNDTLTLVAGPAACSGKAVKSIVIANKPFVQVLPFDSIICLGDTLQLVVTTDNASQVEWLPGNHYQVANTAGNKAWIVPTRDDVVMVKAVGPSGCDTIITIPFTVTSNCCQLMMPGAFTPNHDGLNDVFRPRGNGIQILFFAIYNRFGQLVFSSHSNNAGWNGLFNGYPQDAGTYVYQVQYQCSNSDKIWQQQGTVVLVK